jgi:hypothetical protein
MVSTSTHPPSTSSSQSGVALSPPLQPLTHPLQPFSCYVIAHPLACTQQAFSRPLQALSWVGGLAFSWTLETLSQPLQLRSGLYKHSLGLYKHAYSLYKHATAFTSTFTVITRTLKALTSMLTGLTCTLPTFTSSHSLFFELYVVYKDFCLLSSVFQRIK